MRHLAATLPCACALPAFAKGADAVHGCVVAFDDRAQTCQVQVSFPSTDPSGGSVKGTVTVGLNALQL